MDITYRTAILIIIKVGIVWEAAHCSVLTFLIVTFGEYILFPVDNYRIIINSDFYQKYIHYSFAKKLHWADKSLLVFVFKNSLDLFFRCNSQNADKLGTAPQWRNYISQQSSPWFVLF